MPPEGALALVRQFVCGQLGGRALADHASYVLAFEQAQGPLEHVQPGAVAAWVDAALAGIVPITAGGAAGAKSAVSVSTAERAVRLQRALLTGESWPRCPDVVVQLEAAEKAHRVKRRPAPDLDVRDLTALSSVTPAQVWMAAAELAAARPSKGEPRLAPAVRRQQIRAAALAAAALRLPLAEAIEQLPDAAGLLDAHTAPAEDRISGAGADGLWVPPALTCWRTAMHDLLRMEDLAGTSLPLPPAEDMARVLSAGADAVGQPRWTPHGPPPDLYDEQLLVLLANVDPRVAELVMLRAAALCQAMLGVESAACEAVLADSVELVGRSDVGLTVLLANGQPARRTLVSVPDQRLDAALAVRLWLAVSGVVRGPLFAQVRQTADDEPALRALRRGEPGRPVAVKTWRGKLEELGVAAGVTGLSSDRLKRFYQRRAREQGHSAYEIAAATGDTTLRLAREEREQPGRGANRHLTQDESDGDTR